MRRALSLLAMVLFVLACAKHETKPVGPEKLYTLKGKIVARDVDDNTLRIDHQAIPGFMEAMTMDYPVRGAKVEQLPPNQSRIEAKLHVADVRYWVTDVRQTP